MSKKKNIFTTSLSKTENAMLEKTTDMFEKEIEKETELKNTNEKIKIVMLKSYIGKNGIYSKNKSYELNSVLANAFIKNGDAKKC